MGTTTAAQGQTARHLVGGIVVAWLMVGGTTVFRAQTPAPPVLPVLNQTAVQYVSGDRPAVTVKVLNARATCGGVRAPLAEAPGDGSRGTR